MTIMEVVRSNFFSKSNHTINSVVRNTSCSRGWLRVVVQTIFGTITVASFVLIVIMAVSRPAGKQTDCAVSNCRVVCREGRFNEDYEQSIISAILETGLTCGKIILTLRNVQFTNETLPLNWLSRTSANVERLSVEGGNLRHIPPTAFLGHLFGGLRELVFEEITISSWTSDTFVGLNHLTLLLIKDSSILHIERNALRAIDDTISRISMTNNGKWDPTFVTGTTSLERVKYVYLSQNDFGSTINSKTFAGLNSCKVLFLNSCKIISLGAGAFDPLINIEMLFLNDNYLVTIPPGLFTTILGIKDPKPRIHLQDNRWLCDCSQNDLMLLSQKKLLLVDPICYRPDHMHGKSFSRLEEYCSVDEEDDVEIIFVRKNNEYVKPHDIISRPCFHGNLLLSNVSLRVVSAASQFRCHFKKVGHFEGLSRDWSDGSDVIEISDSNWLKPSFLMQNRRYSTMQVGSSAVEGYGLVWHQSTCPNEAYCVNVMPNFLRLYNVQIDTVYTFCPINLSTADIDVDNCVRYNTSLAHHRQISNKNKILQESPVLYIVTGVLCILFGAMFVYGLIRTNPSLLKGSKRLLFVKHRGVEALVLPPKIPLRNSLTGDENINLDENRIFTVLDDSRFCDNSFCRSNSMRSDKSTTPTYVSAMQPTEAQLAEWRIRNHFDKNDSIISICSDKSKFSWLCEGCSENSSNIAYESLK